MDFPRLWEPIGLGVAGLLCIAYAWKGEGYPDWTRLAAVFVGIFFLAFAVVSAANWLWATVNIRIGEYEAARARGFSSVAQSVRGLRPDQLAAVTHLQNLQIVGLLGSDRALWSLQCVTDKVPLEFVIDFLELSEQTPGYLWPIREHEAVRTSEGSKWANSERLCTELTNAIINTGWAEKSSGPYSAKLLIPLGQVYAKLGLE